MKLYHAVVWTDRHQAKVLQFDGHQVVGERVHEHQRRTPQHGSAVRSEHEFFGELCDAFEGVSEVLVTGGHEALDNFRHYIASHRPLAARQIVGYEVVDHPSENQLVALARHYFAKREVMAGMAAPKGG